MHSNYAAYCHRCRSLRPPQEARMDGLDHRGLPKAACEDRLACDGRIGERILELLLAETRDAADAADAHTARRKERLA